MTNLKPSRVICNSKQGDKTVVVLGAFRGGTSMIAAAVDALGIPMRQSPGLVDPSDGYDNWEDADFAKVLHHDKNYISPILNRGEYHLINSVASEMKERLPIVDELIQTRNASLKSWGWKYPGTVLWVLTTEIL